MSIKLTTLVNSCIMKSMDKVKRGRSRGQQSGFISIFSVMVIMAILTLVAVGFSNLTRRAQRRTLDNQLNTQAFYSAESGVNDAKTLIDASPGTPITKTECQGPMTGFNYNLDAALNVGYTCVLINSQPSDLRIDSVPVEGTASPKTVAFESTTAIGSFDVTWDTTTTLPVTIPSDTGYSGVLATSAVWGSKLGVVRLDLAPTNGSPLDRATMISGSYTIFLYPTTGAGTVTTAGMGASNQGSLIFANCAAAPCTYNVTLTGGTSSKYLMRLQALYNSVGVRISNVRDSIGNPLTLRNGQAVVDVTGRASDVFRRIQVRLPYYVNGYMPGFAVQSADSICKRLLGSLADSTVDITGVPVPDQTGVCSLTN